MSIAAEASEFSFPSPPSSWNRRPFAERDRRLCSTSAEEASKLSRQIAKKRDDLRGRTLINLFFEASTRTQSSFELAGKRLGADVMNMSVGTSSVQKGETLIDTAVTLNAMRPDILVVRHHAAGAVELLAQKVDCSVINAGDGSHEHPTQALLDALTIRRHKGRIEGLIVAICGDILHSRVARSNILCLNTLGARVRVVAPSTLLASGIERLGVEVYTSMWEGLADADIVMMLRLQRERMTSSLVPSQREYFHFFGLDYDKLARAKPDALDHASRSDEPRRRDRLQRRRRRAKRHPRAGRDGRGGAHGGAPGAWPAICRTDDRDASADPRSARLSHRRARQCAADRSRLPASTASGGVLIMDGAIADLGPHITAGNGRATPRSSIAPAACSPPA